MRAAPAADEEHRRERDREEAQTHRYFLIRTTCDVLPSPCLNTSLTSPLPGANQQVRVPLPNLKPGCFIVVRTASAWNVPPGTLTFWMPSTVEEPVTPYDVKSEPVGDDCHWSPGFAYAGM